MNFRVTESVTVQDYTDDHLVEPCFVGARYTYTDHLLITDSLFGPDTYIFLKITPSTADNHKSYSENSLFLDFLSWGMGWGEGGGGGFD